MIRKFLNYKFLFKVWLTIGILISGYYYLFQPMIEYEGEWGVGYRSNDNYYKVSLLITIVGLVLIGGIGYIRTKQKIQK